MSKYEVYNVTFKLSLDEAYFIRFLGACCKGTLINMIRLYGTAVEFFQRKLSHRTFYLMDDGRLKPGNGAIAELPKLEIEIDLEDCASGLLALSTALTDTSAKVDETNEVHCHIINQSNRVYRLRSDTNGFFIPEFAQPSKIVAESGLADGMLAGGEM